MDSVKFDANLESKVLDWLRFPMIVLVVYIHWWGENIAEMFPLVIQFMMLYVYL